ncbi:MAG: hypothetical protein EHM36_02275 [Deltaproteobacteria bacterium]|nr:MAG: hypothetical protein EHM36_02275 [Deltaproteobacteria bacterium]
MPRCIFCDKSTEHDIARGRSLCFDCLIRLKKFEVANAREMTRRLFGDEFCNALGRLNKMDMEKVDAASLKNLKEDIEIIKKQSPC